MSYDHLLDSVLRMGMGVFIGTILSVLLNFLYDWKPVALNLGLLWLIYGLLWGIVACDFWQLGFPGGV